MKISQKWDHIFMHKHSRSELLIRIVSIGIGSDLLEVAQWFLIENQREKRISRKSVNEKIKDLI